MKKLFAEPEANIYKLTCTDIVYTSDAQEITEPTESGTSSSIELP